MEGMKTSVTGKAWEQGEREAPPQVEREPEETDAPGAPAEPADAQEEEQADAGVQNATGPDWRARAEAAEERVAALGDRLGAVEAAAEDLRRIVSESEHARQVDRELLIAGVVDLEGARLLVEEQVAAGVSVLEAVERVKERRPLLFAVRARGGVGVRATAMPAVEREGSRPVAEVALAAQETGDRRLLLRYLRMRRGEG